MSTLMPTPASAGQFQNQNTLSDAQVSSYMRKQSVSAYQQLSAGLTIQTKQGDLVTLTSDSYMQYDAFMYNSKGMIRTETGSLSVSRNLQQITLSSGESFSFTVKGDLNEQELEDISNIVKGIDEIISQVTKGDMDEAVDKALAMGGYDTVSMYSADISYERSYRSVSETTEQIKTTENYPSTKGHQNILDQTETMIKKMMDQLETSEDKLLPKTRGPVKKLFRHHLDEMKDQGRERSDIYKAIEHTGRRMDRFFDKMNAKLFDDFFLTA